MKMMTSYIMYEFRDHSMIRNEYRSNIQCQKYQIRPYYCSNAKGKLATLMFFFLKILQ